MHPAPSLPRVLNLLWFETCKALMPPRRILPLEEIKLRNSLLKGECVYCGDEAKSKDHFRPVVSMSGLPSGYCDDEWNIVPCCITCNSCKGNRHWLSFMRSATPRSPLGRGKTRNAHRIKALQAFEQVGAKYVQRWPADAFSRELMALKSSLGDLTVSYRQRLHRMVHNVIKQTGPRPKGRRFACRQTIVTRSSKTLTWVLPHRVRTRGSNKCSQFTPASCNNI